MTLTLTAPYRQSHYMGQYAGDTAANTAIGSVGWTLSEGMLYFDTTGGVDALKYYDGSAWQTISSGGVTQWNEQNIVHVAPHGSDSNNGDAINLAKLTIASAITRAAALSPTITNRITILIHPGEYDEAVATADAYVDLIGVDRDACIIRRISSGIPLSVVDDNLRIANLTIDKTGSAQNFTLRIDDATGVEIENLRVLMDGDANDQVQLVDVSGVTFRDCIFEDVVSDANSVLSDNAGGTYYFYNCIFKGTISTTASYYFYGCRFESSGGAICTFSATSAQVVRMIGCSVFRTGGLGDGVRIGTGTFLDWGIIGCDIDGAAGSGGEDIQCAAINPGYVQGNIIGTTLAQNVVLKSECRRRIATGGGIDVYDDLEEAIISLPTEGGVIELMEDYNIGSDIVQSKSKENLILEGNGFTISGTGIIEDSSGSVFEIRNVVLDGVIARLRAPSAAPSTVILRNVRVIGSGTTGFVQVTNGAAAGSKLILDGVDVDGSGLTQSNPLNINNQNGVEINVNDSSFTGRTASGSAGAAVYFHTSLTTVFRAINSLFIHPSGTGTDYEIDAGGAQTVYTQYCMTRANAIGAAPNITEGITGGNNIIDPNAGFLWR